MGRAKDLRVECALSGHGELERDVTVTASDSTSAGTVNLKVPSLTQLPSLAPAPVTTGPPARLDRHGPASLNAGHRRSPTVTAGLRVTERQRQCDAFCIIQVIRVMPPAGIIRVIQVIILHVSAGPRCRTITRT